MTEELQPAGVHKDFHKDFHKERSKEVHKHFIKPTGTDEKQNIHQIQNAVQDANLLAGRHCLFEQIFFALMMV